MQAQVQQLAAERDKLAEEKSQLATNVCRLEAQVQNHQLVAEARAKREAGHTVTVLQLQVRPEHARRIYSLQLHLTEITACTCTDRALINMQADIVKAREEMQHGAQAFLSDTADFQTKYSLDALEARKAAIQADFASCTAQHEVAVREHSRLVATQQVVQRLAAVAV
jgi:hypothetical protein